MFSVPLRRALVTGSDLPYPEGVAAAEVLKVGAAEDGDEENAKGLRGHRPRPRSPPPASPCSPR